MSSDPQTKQELLDRIQSARRALEGLLARLDAQAMQQPGPNGGWSVKDHLAHLAEWSRKQLALIDGQPGHEGLGIDQALYENGGIDAINAELYRRNNQRTLEDVLADFRASHETMVSRITQMSDADLRRVNNLKDPEGKRTLLEGIASNTYEHDEEHVEWIKEML